MNEWIVMQDNIVQLRKDVEVMKKRIGIPIPPGKITPRISSAARALAYDYLGDSAQWKHWQAHNAPLTQYESIRVCDLANQFENEIRNTAVYVLMQKMGAENEKC